MKLVVLALTFIFSTTFFLQESEAGRRGRLKRTRNRQEARINKGVENGNLTEREAARLKRNQNRLEKREAHLISDGEISKSDRRKIRRGRKRANRKIRRQMHDNQTTDGSSVGDSSTGE